MSIEHFNREVFIRESREVGYEEGLRAGIEKGMQQAIEQGKARIRREMLAKFLENGGTPEQAMTMLGVTQEELDIELK